MQSNERQVKLNKNSFERSVRFDKSNLFRGTYRQGNRSLRLLFQFKNGLNFLLKD